MKYKILLVEHDGSSLRVLKRVIGKANLDVVTATTLTEAKIIFENSTPESFLCAVVDYALPDAPHGEAIDFAIASFVPVIVITSQTDKDVRERILSKAVVDYIPKSNSQIYEYLSRLLTRLEKNRDVGVLVVGGNTRSRNDIYALLNRHNFISYQAANGEKALEMLNQNPHIKLIITDQKLPDMTGVDLVSKVRKTHTKESLSVIGTSEKGDAALLANFIKSGANDYLRRPYCHEEFFCRILQNVEYVEQIEVIKKTANTDYLTKLPNRRHFFAQVEKIMHSKPQSVSLALIDLDYFKTVNDNYGHDFGDVVLKETARMMQKHFAQDVVSRFGGEEFCVFLSNIEASAAKEKLDAFREAISEKSFKYKDQQVHCTLSIGISHKRTGKIESLLSTADEFLYKAKARGRNCIVDE
ncbi:diguanylate cyclase [Glaciecola sp. XM2]|uniref:GGDEF domain-containing response regulator n=1 Tax=Glaciecola sp. XM2 TaxID=1914931 RepID=UPI001BDEAA06|nr:diguanylate cyclase [Glaciecola sp. XM2]